MPGGICRQRSPGRGQYKEWKAHRELVCAELSRSRWPPGRFTRRPISSGYETARCRRRDPSRRQRWSESPRPLRLCGIPRWCRTRPPGGVVEGIRHHLIDPQSSEAAMGALREICPEHCRKIQRKPEDCRAWRPGGPDVRPHFRTVTNRQRRRPTILPVAVSTRICHRVVTASTCQRAILSACIAICLPGTSCFA